MFNEHALKETINFDPGLKKSHLDNVNTPQAFHICPARLGTTTYIYNSRARTLRLLSR